jgi:hypothetical protein
MHPQTQKEKGVGKRSGEDPMLRSEAFASCEFGYESYRGTDVGYTSLNQERIQAVNEECA